MNKKNALLKNVFRKINVLLCLELRKQKDACMVSFLFV